jgi:hypothetical protein
MATRTIVETTCDMPRHQRPVPAGSYELFSKMTGGRVAIDLCDACSSKLFAAFTEHGTEIVKGRTDRIAVHTS